MLCLRLFLKGDDYLVDSYGNGGEEEESEDEGGRSEVARRMMADIASQRLMSKNPRGNHISFPRSRTYFIH